jgi:hypothetical protein
MERLGHGRRRLGGSSLLQRRSLHQGLAVTVVAARGPAAVAAAAVALGLAGLAGVLLLFIIFRALFRLC